MWSYERFSIIKHDDVLDLVERADRVVDLDLHPPRTVTRRRTHRPPLSSAKARRG